MYVTLATDQISLELPNEYDHWAGLKTELVFDNTRNVGMNLYYGTCAINCLPNIINWWIEITSIAVVGFDIRHYQKISRTFIWANRIAGSTSLGNDNLIYYMGGVDNWLIPKFNYDTPIDYEQNYAYQTLATNMRGFNQNIRNGNSFVVINSELRFPLFQYFSKTPLSSSFLRNFQLVAFGDIGTAWTGVSPYSPENAFTQNMFKVGPCSFPLKFKKNLSLGDLDLVQECICSDIS